MSKSAKAKPKKSVNYNESVVQITFPRVTTPDKTAVFSSKKEI